MKTSEGKGDISVGIGCKGDDFGEGRGNGEVLSRLLDVDNDDLTLFFFFSLKVKQRVLFDKGVLNIVNKVAFARGHETPHLTLAPQTRLPVYFYFLFFVDHHQSCPISLRRPTFRTLTRTLLDRNASNRTPACLTAPRPLLRIVALTVSKPWRRSYIAASGPRPK